MGLPSKKVIQKFTVKDYLTWPENERWELINGTAYNMIQAPNTEHQRIISNLSFLILSFLNGKTFSGFIAPTDVYLPEHSDDTDDIMDTVVQPDFFIVCDPGKIEKRGIRGAPDLTIEILSPYTEKKDWNEKFYLYESNGVKEYWVINPAEKVLHQYHLQNSVFQLIKIHESGSIVESPVFNGLKIDLKQIFK